jgi:hypothetical protein
MVGDFGAWEKAGLLYEIDDRGAAWLRLNRPEKRTQWIVPFAPRS